MKHLQLVPTAPKKQPPAIAPLDSEIRTSLPTNEAAPHLGRKPQTLRAWACLENGPIRPHRLHGRLLWPVADIRRLLGA